MNTESYMITSPLMGTFYRSSAPGEKALVEEGQSVKAAEVVCIIESMKLFTEIRTEKSGIVKRILVENEEPVMKNQDLMEIVPDE